MYDNNPYQAYSDGSVLSKNPLSLVVALYEGAVDAVRTASLCLESGDILGRTRAVNKAVSILTELMVSLNQDQGGEIAANLKKLYSYMQRRLLEAHLKKTAAPLTEVEGLLQTMLDGWTQAAAGSSAVETAGASQAELPQANNAKPAYGSYWNDLADTQAQSAYSF